MENMQVARRIRAFRKLKGFTQKQLADDLSISLAVLGEMERGSRAVDEHILIEIAEVIGVGLEELQNA